MAKNADSDTCRLVQKDQLQHWRNLYNGVVYLEILIRECPFHVKKENWDQNTPEGTWHQIKIRERKGPSRGIIPKYEPHERSPCVPKVGERLADKHEETLHQERCARREAWDLSNKIFSSSRMPTKLRFYFPVEARVMPAPTSKKTRGVRIRSRFRSVNAHDEQKRLKLKWIGYFAKIHEHLCGANLKWESACTRGSTGVRSRSWPLRDCAITRRNACCSIVWKTLRRPRISIYEWVCGQNTTVGQRGEDNCMRNGQFRTSCRARGIHQFWKHSAFHHHTRARREKKVEKASGNSWRSASSSSSSPVLERSDGMKKQKYKKGMTAEIWTTRWQIFRSGWRSSQIIQWNRIAGTRTQFSGLRFGTSCESGIKNQESTVFTPRRSKLRSLLANQNDKGSLQKTQWRSSISSRKVWWIDNLRS